MGLFSSLRLTVAALALSVAACAPTPTAAPSIVAPLPVAYTCEQFARAAAEYRALPPGAMLGQMLDDYRIERAALRALHGLPVPKCP